MLEKINEQNVSELESMIQHYEEEFSSITGKQRNEEGKFELDVDWREPNSGFYWVINKIKLGFCILHEVDGHFDVAEFYVIPSYRGMGVGEEMAFALFERFKGPWQVRQIKGARIRRPLFGEKSSQNILKENMSRLN